MNTYANHSRFRDALIQAEKSYSALLYIFFEKKTVYFPKKVIGMLMFSLQFQFTSQTADGATKKKTLHTAPLTCLFEKCKSYKVVNVDPNKMFQISWNKPESNEALSGFRCPGESCSVSTWISSVSSVFFLRRLFLEEPQGLRRSQLHLLSHGSLRSTRSSAVEMTARTKCRSYPECNQSANE